MPKSQTSEKRPEPVRTMPHNLEAEQSVLGCALFDESVQSEIFSQLTEDDFYSESHRMIYEGMLRVARSSVPVDFVTLSDDLEKTGTIAACGGIGYLTEISQSVPSAANYQHYVDIVHRDSVLRRLIRAGGDIIREAGSDVTEQAALGFAEKQIFDISSKAEGSKLTSITSELGEVIEKFETLASDKDAYTGIKTGLDGLDEILNGLHRSDLVLIAARPAMGKTSLAMNIVENIATLRDGVCAVFSLEMPKIQIAQRMMCSIANVSMSKALKGNLEMEDWQKLWKANKKLSDAKIFVDDSSMNTPYDILSKCRRLKAREGRLDVVMIDYIQLMTTGKKTSSDNRQQDVSEISRSLKILAREVDVPVVALSQLSRAVESRTSHKPQLSDLRESGAIEQDADIVLFIHRPDRVEANEDKVLKGEVQKDVAEIIIAKHRNGPTGSVNLRWIGECTKFVSMSRAAEEIAKAYHLEPEAPRERRAVPAEELPFDLGPGADPTEGIPLPEEAPAPEEAPLPDESSLPPEEPGEGTLSELDFRAAQDAWEGKK